MGIPMSRRPCTQLGIQASFPRGRHFWDGGGGGGQILEAAPEHPVASDQVFTREEATNEWRSDRALATDLKEVEAG